VSEDILLIERKGPVATLILNRPEKRNSLSPELLVRLHQTLETMKEEDRVRVVVLRGAGDRAFSSGYDLAAISTDRTVNVQEELTRNPLERVIQSVLDFPYPILALLNGDAFGGGCDLAVCCDLRIGADDIRMGMPPAKLGLVYPIPGLLRFVRTIGLDSTRELFFTGRYYEAQRAREMGLLHHVLPRDELELFACAMAEEIAANAPLSLRGIKHILRLISQTTPLPDQAFREVDQLLAQALNSEDFKEGREAFWQKRKPVFKGR
jgi:enoyl-CoA hydratase